MKEGFVIILDVLGFKGIWNRLSTEQIVSGMRSFEADVARFAKQVNANGQWQMPFFFSSDTFIAGIQFEAETNRENNLVTGLEIISRIACGFESWWVKPPFQRQVRGAIGYGQFVIDGNIMIGPAIDQTAEIYEEPDGPFVVLTEAASSQWEMVVGRKPGLNADLVGKSKISARGLDLAFMEWEVPRKAPSVSKKCVIHAPFRSDVSAQSNGLLNYGLEAFDVEPTNSGAARKKANTIPLYELLRR